MLAVDNSFALGSIFAEVAKEDTDTLLDWLKRLSIIVESGVQSVGPPASYALVWEYGNARQTKKGPKTVQGRNAAGQFTNIWFSIQAPSGWIAINEPALWKVIEEEIAKVHFEKGSIDSLKQELEKAYITISERALELLKATVPIDSGDLHDSLEVVKPGDEVLDEISELAESINEVTGQLNL